MSGRQWLMIALVFGATSAVAAPAKAQLGSQPQLSPYLYLTQGGTQGFLNYRQALDQQQFQRQVAPIIGGNEVGREINRTTNFQANPQTTGISQTAAQTGRATGVNSSFMYFSHFYGPRPVAARPY